MGSLNSANSVTKIPIEPATSCVRDKDAIAVPAGTCERQDLYIEPSSCFSDLSDSLNWLKSLNSMKVLLDSGKSPKVQSEKLLKSYVILHAKRAFNVTS